MPSKMIHNCGELRIHQVERPATAVTRQRVQDFVKLIPVKFGPSPVRHTHFLLREHSVRVFSDAKPAVNFCGMSVW